MNEPIIINITDKIRIKEGRTVKKPTTLIKGE